MDDILKFTNALKKGGSSSGSLFGEAVMKPPALKLKPVTPATNGEKLTWEKELIGFFISNHPITACAPIIEQYKAKTIAEVMATKSETQIVRTYGLISKIHNIVTKNGQAMLFATIEDNVSPTPLEIVVFASILEKTAPVWVLNNCVLVDGKMSNRDGQAKMLAENAKKMEV